MMEEISTNQSYADNQEIEYNVSEEHPSMSQNPQFQDEKLQKNSPSSPESPESTGQARFVKSDDNLKSHIVVGDAVKENNVFGNGRCRKNQDNIGYILDANPPDVERSVKKCHFNVDTEGPIKGVAGVGLQTLTTKQAQNFLECGTADIMSLYPCQNACESNQTQQGEETNTNGESEVENIILNKDIVNEEHGNLKNSTDDIPLCQSSIQLHLTDSQNVKRSKQEVSNDSLLPPASTLSLPLLPSQLPVVLTSIESQNHSCDVSNPHYAEMCEKAPGDITHDVHVDIISVPTTISTLVPTYFQKSSNLEVTKGEASNVKLEDEASLTVDQSRSASPIIELPVESEDPDLVPRHPPEKFDKVKGMIPLYKLGPSVTAECKICLEEKALHLRPCCNAAICDTCMTTYLEGVIQEGKVKIFCPGLCPETYIPRQEIVGRISPEMKDKFYKFLINANSEPHIKTCPRCSHVLEVELAQIQKRSVKKKGYSVTCASCQLRWCFPCQSPWHQDITCKEFCKGDKLLKTWANMINKGQANARKCPTCKVFIQRIDGCDYMVCSRCHTSFCYKCGGHYFKLKFIGHKSKFSILGCKYLYKPDNDTLRRLIRGSIFGAMLIVAPMLVVLAIVALFFFSGYYLLFRPIKKLVKYWQDKRRAMKYARWKANEYEPWNEYVRSMKFDGDPYIKMFNSMQRQRVSAFRVAEAADITAGSHEPITEV